jgi:hypothetical protein
MKIFLLNIISFKIIRFPLLRAISLGRRQQNTHQQKMDTRLFQNNSSNLNTANLRKKQMFKLMIRLSNLKEINWKLANKVKSIFQSSMTRLLKWKKNFKLWQDNHKIQIMGETHQKSCRSKLDLYKKLDRTEIHSTPLEETNLLLLVLILMKSTKKWWACSITVLTLFAISWNHSRRTLFHFKKKCMNRVGLSHNYIMELRIQFLEVQWKREIQGGS